MTRSGIVVFLVGCLLVQAFCAPGNRRPGNQNRPLRADTGENASDNQETNSQTTSSTSSYDLAVDDDDDDFGDEMQTSPSTGGGSNFMSLLNLASALFPTASAANFERIIRNLIREYFVRNPIMLRRQDVADNVIEIDYVNELTPPFLRLENENNENGTNESDDDNDTKESDENSTHESDENGTNESDENGTNESEDNRGDDSSNDSKSQFEGNDNAAEESVEQNTSDNDKASKQDSGLNDDDDSDYSDEPPGGGDGQGGGVLGLLAGLSGGEDGQSDLGSLLAAVSGIVGNLSGDGFDFNALIATAFGLFVGILSEGEENPGTVIASYLLTSLETITGGGFKNNGAFFGNFLSKLIKGTSVVSDESGSSEENGNKMPMSDSTGFFVSLLMSLSGDMSKGSSGGSSAWRR